MSAVSRASRRVAASVDSMRCESEVSDNRPTIPATASRTMTAPNPASRRERMVRSGSGFTSGSLGRSLDDEGAVPSDACHRDALARGVTGRKESYRAGDTAEGLGEPGQPVANLLAVGAHGGECRGDDLRRVVAERRVAIRLRPL